MTRFTIAVLLAGCATATTPPILQSVAPAHPACAPGNGTPRWVASRGTATVCFASDVKTCFAVSNAQAPQSVAAPARSESPPGGARLRDLDGVLSACAGTRCTAIGARTRAALARTKAAYVAHDVPRIVALTGDGKTLVIGSGESNNRMAPQEAWSVADDKQLVIAPPREYVTAQPHLYRLEVVNGSMISSWQDCAGPCERAVLVDSRGRNRGAWFAGERGGDGAATPLGANRLVATLGEATPGVVVIDLATAAQRPAPDGLGFDKLTGIELDDTTLVAAWNAKGAWRVALLSLPPGEPARITRSHRIPHCEP